MANVVAKLRCLDHRGETVHTRWGDVIFDRDGLADLEVPEEDVALLRAHRPYSWLADDHVPQDEPEITVEADPPPAAKKPQPPPTPPQRQQQRR